MNANTLPGWDRLRHSGLLLDPPRLQSLARFIPQPLHPTATDELRRRAATLNSPATDPSAFVAFVLERICNFTPGHGTWLRGPAVGPEWNRRTPTGESLKPRHLWLGIHNATLPVFLDPEKHIGLGRGKRTASLVVQWLRNGPQRLALLTNGRQWRLIFAGLDFDAFCEWDSELWFEEGQLAPQLTTLRTLLSPQLWTPPAHEQLPPLLNAVLDSRKGQAELSASLGERVREAVELLVQAHGETLRQTCNHLDPAEIYRAAVRVVMRIVVILFAESRDLLPRDNALYHTSYGVTGLLEELQKSAARGANRLARSHSAWPRILALFNLVHHGSHHPALPVPAYGGQLFAPADPAHTDGLNQALLVFESATFKTSHAIFPDRDVLQLLEKISRTRVKLRQGRQNTSVTVPVDFSDLSSEYIGILYEGLLDFELRTAPTGDPVVFLAVGNQPALPLSRLESMDDKALAALLEKMKDTSSAAEESADEDAANDATANETADGPDTDAPDAPEDPDADETTEPLLTPETATETETETETADHRHITRTRAETWARRAVIAGKLVTPPRTRNSAEKARALEDAVARKARQLVARVVLPGEWFLVRWGGTRKGSGTFYTRPGLAVPTVHRTLQPLAWTPPNSPDGTPNPDAPACDWTPRPPEDILALKTCDPACGSGTFRVAALRYLTDALYASVHYHGRVSDNGDRSIVSLLGPPQPHAEHVAALGQEMIPCRPDDPSFEPRLKAVLKRHVVERCIYGVDLDPLAVELCRLALWIETMDRNLPFSFLDHKIKCGNGLVGAWFDQFLHYPAMAWKNREGGDKTHSNGVHFPREARGRTLREFATGPLKEDLNRFLSGPDLFDPRNRAQEAVTAHTDALNLLARLHELPVHDAAERARIYRDELLAAPAWQRLKSAMDLWCACWFWPAEDIQHAPLPSTLAEPSPETIAIANRIAARLRFFHWELEFPDVFSAERSGFDAILGNPPWDIAKPNSKEFFSNIDPLYRTYGKQEALRTQTGYFADIAVERQWLDYNADFRAQSNFMKYAAGPYGDPDAAESSDRYGIARGKDNAALHARWRGLRSRTTGYADPGHPFRRQGSADINLYKAFLEAAHALLRTGGRLGFIVPSGIYSDHGTGDLRRLFLDRCQWEWLFGFENREGVFEIDSRFKFNPVIITKGGTTTAIRTAFMRRKLEDWERAEQFATPYTRAQVDQFSPRSQAILEIQSARDLEILEKIYANSVLLGDDGPDGWGIRYATEFHMTSDSKLFPPRTKWEEQGYRPDEYSRWLKGDWRPIAELWTELGIDPDTVTPPGVLLEPWLFDTTATPERRTAEARFIHGHLLKPGDVAPTTPRRRTAQPPYDSLPIPRADIPAGIILSREADAWIREDRVEDVALPLYEGRMIGQFDFSQKGWVSGKGRTAVWRETDRQQKAISPQFLMASNEYAKARQPEEACKLIFMDVSSSTNSRSMIASIIPDMPAGNKVPTLSCHNNGTRDRTTIFLAMILNSFVYDYQLRTRFGGLSLNYFILEETALHNATTSVAISDVGSQILSISAAEIAFASQWLRSRPSELLNSWRSGWKVADFDKLRMRCMADVVTASFFGLSINDMHFLLRECDFARGSQDQTNPKGFWRVDKDKDPELRHTVLTLIAFHDLEAKIRENNGDRDAGIAAFLSQNHGEGWLLPETLRLADYGLGHDDRAQHPQPVATRLGPRFYDWQLTQTPEESWRECHLHARNLLGPAGYQQLLTDIENTRNGTPTPPPSSPPTTSPTPTTQQRQLF